MNSGINKVEESYNSEIESEIYNMEGPNLIQNNSELAILQKNKQIFLSFNQIDFNVLIVGESNSGKTTFIKNFLKKVEKLSSHSGKSSDNYNDFFAKDGNQSNEFKVFTVNTLSISQNYNLRMIDSPGYCSRFNKDEWLNYIIEFINNKVF